MYLEIFQQVNGHNTLTIFPVTCKEEAAELVKTTRKYHKDESLSITLKEKGKIISLEV